ncbi:MAG: hypothetical protein A3F13_03405 [Gammaproteobacteria bacterium RIFCSPHIGHO2_12_FULL_40_19]|nr:MAG: hypothetical protein A3F13_03405 [Gammaproteobacteria bacterium RIFCSPHIGHO2_12_FULL_40_19]
MIRKILLLTTIMLGWINLPAQAFLLSDDQNLWPVMSQQFSLPVDTDKIDVRKQLDWDLRNPKYIHRLTQNARPYLFTIFQETQKLHLPAELALLPMIESEYVPYGSSNRGAVGLWQLMPSTAADYGVKMNSLYDGRRSTAVSTRVALHFLSYLYEQFDHNWLLALAAYNAGPGTVTAAIHYNQKRGRPTDFWALPLPKETQVYIPKLLALAAIIQHPNTYGIHLSPVPNKAVTGTVTIVKQMKLETIANLAQTSVHTVQKLNPAFRGKMTPAHQVVTLVLPAHNQPVFVQHMQAQKETDKMVTTQNLDHYTVQHGDSVGGIASKFKTTIETIEKINQLHDGIIHLNQALLVPKLIAAAVDGKSAQPVPVPTQNKQAPTPPPTVTSKNTVNTAQTTVQPTVYRVKHGDNLGIIAHRLHVTRRQLEHWNHLRARSTLRVGEKLKIESKTVTALPTTKAKTAVVAKNNQPVKNKTKTNITSHKNKSSESENEHIYIVRQGDNLHRLAERFDTTTYHIIQHNHLKHAVLRVGEHLLLPNA